MPDNKVSREQRLGLLTRALLHSQLEGLRTPNTRTCTGGSHAGTRCHTGFSEKAAGGGSGMIFLITPRTVAPPVAQSSTALGAQAGR